MDVFGKKYKLRMLAESASSFHQSFKYSQWWCFVFKKKFFFYIVPYSWELHISFKMDTEKVLYQKIIGKSYIVKLYCQIQYIIFLCTKPSFWRVQIQNYCTGKHFCSDTSFKRNKVKVHVFLKVTKLTCFGNS